MSPIKKFRRQASMSQWDVVEAMGNVVSQATISLWELGRRQPNEEQVELLARVLGVDPSALSVTGE